MKENNENFRILEAEASRQLRNLLSSKTAFRVFETEERKAKRLQNEPLTFELQNKLTGQNATIFASVLKIAQPRQINEAVQKLRQRPKKKNIDNDFCDLIIAPSFSVKTRNLLEEHDVGWLDFGGNVHLEVSNHIIHIEGLPVPKQHKKRATYRSLFSPKSLRVLRALMQGPLTSYKVEELANTADVSLGLVSKVRRTLLDHELANSTKKGISLNDPQELLEEWLFEDRFENRTETHELSTLHSNIDLANKLLEYQRRTHSEQPLFTLDFAASLRSPHNIPTTVSAYLEKFPIEEEFLTSLKARPVSQGAGNLRIIIPNDFKALTIDQQKAKKFNNLPLVSDLQLYLDLHGGEPNGVEQAQVLRDLEDFNGGWS